MERFFVYVVELDKPWKIYVGSSALPPNERFGRHKLGGLGTSRHVRRQGTRVRPDLYAHLNPLPTRQSARAAEQRLRAQLSARGYQIIGGSCRPHDDGCFGI